MSNLLSSLRQSFFIPSPPLTEQNLRDQSGKVFLITGGYAGVGYSLTKILYQHNATVYVAGRSKPKAETAIADITAEFPDSKGSLKFISVDLSDLTTIRPAVQDFLSKETKLNWLNNNAGVMHTPKGAKGAQGIDMQYQTNILGPFLLTKLLLPILKNTAKSEPAGSVRVSWAGSLSIDLEAGLGALKWKDGTLDDFDNINTAYAASKAANYFLAYEFGQRFGTEDNVLHNCYNPGNLNSELSRHHSPNMVLTTLANALLHDPVYGAYTELYAGLSPDLTVDKSQGIYLIPWGRVARVRTDIEEERGGDRNSGRLYTWCEKVTAEFA